MPFIHRNRAASGPPPTFNEIVATLGPIHHWRLNEESGAFLDSGSGAVDAAAIDNPIRGLPGFSLNESGLLVGSNGAGRGAVELDSTVLTAQSTGAILVLYRNSTCQWRNSSSEKTPVTIHI